ncbi:tRNA dihydrouridine(20/20a) synthase DusA [Acuticoccus sp. MNP-M23]|uniref:tRNA dihydrouridine(20/20a) synthase DusA n=1 Tax=Acuticoccus sp. MNP-M23 TaxID=3072793 RepID=UPI0028157CA0|nr:tRNA dihydrouridine(20/20a) synthase DusA [Acuticoccus sp. MNP-M23]WMS42056.1 tRNA dihydrouridine(20/20a) synthase DusA [Acuticoccus sp. MNP-M23]
MIPDSVRRLAVAPMMDWTDRHCRVFHRQLHPSTQLFTEMVTAKAILFGDRARLLGFSPQEEPLALQLGGAEPGELAKAARIAAEWGYGEVNLNVGCPSDRVQGGSFGACLMREPLLVGECLAAMGEAGIAVTLKCRIGVDDQDPEEALDRVADAAVGAGVEAIWVHARKAWLEGLSPAQNRDIPPLDYARVFRLKARLPVFVGLNGGIGTAAEAMAHLAEVDGVMIGRAAYQRPAILSVLAGYEGAADKAHRLNAARAMVPYAAEWIAQGGRLSNVVRHMLGLFHGEPGARAYRRTLTVAGQAPGADAGLLADAIDAVEAAGIAAATARAAAFAARPDEPRATGDEAGAVREPA